MSIKSCYISLHRYMSRFVTYWYVLYIKYWLDKWQRPQHIEAYKDYSRYYYKYVTMVQGLMTRSKKSLSRHQNNIGFWIKIFLSMTMSAVVADYNIFDFDPSLGTVLNQLNLPVLFCYLLHCGCVSESLSFSSVLYQQLCQGFSAASSKNVPQESTLMTTTRNRRIYLWWLVGGGGM